MVKYFSVGLVCGGIAQLGERLLDKQEVTGSKPVVPTSTFIPNPTKKDTQSIEYLFWFLTAGRNPPPNPQRPQPPILPFKAKKDNNHIFMWLLSFGRSDRI